MYTSQKMKFSIKDSFSKIDQIRRKLKKSLMENFIFCAVVHLRLIDKIINFNDNLKAQFRSEKTSGHWNTFNPV